MKYRLEADGFAVWEGGKMPTRAVIDWVAAKINARGWNGTEMELYKHGEWIKTVTPSDDVLYPHRRGIRFR